MNIGKPLYCLALLIFSSWLAQPAFSEPGYTVRYCHGEYWSYASAPKQLAWPWQLHSDGPAW